MSEYQYNKAVASAEQDGMKMKLRNCTKDDTEEVRLAYFNYLEHMVHEEETTLKTRRGSEAKPLPETPAMKEMAISRVKKGKEKEERKQTQEVENSPVETVELDATQESPEKPEPGSSQAVTASEKKKDSKKTESKRTKAILKAEEKLLMRNPLFDEGDRAVEANDVNEEHVDAPIEQPKGKKRKASDAVGSKSKRRVSSSGSKENQAPAVMEVESSEQEAGGGKNETAMKEAGPYDGEEGEMVALLSSPRFFGHIQLSIVAGRQRTKQYTRKSNLSSSFRKPLNQCCASGPGSCRIRNYLQLRIRIRN
jgi:hypothetical protein